MNRRLKLFLLSQAVVASVAITFLPAFSIELEGKLAEKIDQCTTWQVDEETSMEEFEARTELIDCVEFAKYSDIETIEEFAHSKHPYTFPRESNNEK